MFRLHGRGRLHGHIYKSVCVHKNVYAYISSKCVQQYVYIYTCVVLSALFLCADDVILLEREKKKDYPIVSLGWTQRKKIFLSHSQAREERKRKRFHTLGQKGTKQLFISQFFFFVFFLLVKTFLRVLWLRQKREREREKRSRRERTQIHTHTSL